jgi:hypothetical protein
MIAKDPEITPEELKAKSQFIALGSIDEVYVA